MNNNIVTLYFSTSEHDLESVLNAIPNPYFVEVFESWTSVRKFGRELEKEPGKELGKEESTDGNNPKRQPRIVTLTEAILIVDKRDINSLKYYLRVNPHKNFYAKEHQDNCALYCVFTPKQKVETDRILRIFCKKMNLVMPKFVPKNGFSFYIFESDEFVPQIIGLLNAYPSLEGAKFRYGRKRASVKKEPLELLKPETSKE